MKTLFTTTSVRKCYLFVTFGYWLLLFNAPVALGAHSASNNHISFSTGTSSGFHYFVGVDSIYRTKDILAAVTDQLKVTHRYITASGFTFFSEYDYTQAFLEELFQAQGVPGITLIKEAGKHPLESMEKVGGTNCEQAQILCANSSLSGNSSGYGTQELNSSNGGCLVGYEHQSSWYYLNVQTGGSLGLTIDPASNTDDYDFAVWGPFTSATAGANCPPISSPIRCSFSALDDLTGMISSYYGQTSSFGCGFLGLFACYGTVTVSDNSETASGDSWVSPLTVSANQIYILLIDNFSTSSNPYSLTFSGTAVLGCTPIVLPVELTAFEGGSTETGNILKWTTESERDNDYFLVESLVNTTANQWETVGKVYSEGDSWSEKNYTLLDPHPVKDHINYYRITQFDRNGISSVHDKMVAIDNSLMQRQVVKTLNLLGQEVNEQTTGIVIYLFEDGTSLKVFR